MVGRSVMDERWAGYMEVITGSVLVSSQFWAQLLDEVVRGAHAVAAIGGAFIAVHGMVRIWRTR